MLNTFIEEESFMSNRNDCVRLSLEIPIDSIEEVFEEEFIKNRFLELIRSDELENEMSKMLERIELLMSRIRRLDKINSQLEEATDYKIIVSSILQNIKIEAFLNSIENVTLYGMDRKQAIANELTLAMAIRIVGEVFSMVLNRCSEIYSE